MNHSMHCPWCSYVAETPLPARLPFIDFSPAYYWTGLKFGFHAVRNHPIEYDEFRDKEAHRFLEWYLAQPHYNVREELQDKTAEEIAEEIGEDEIRQDIIDKFHEN